MKCFCPDKKVLVIRPREEFGDFVVEIRLGNLSTAQMRVDAIQESFGPMDNFWVRKYREGVAEDRFYSASSLEY